MSEGTRIKDRATRLTPGLTPRLLTRDEAAAYCGIGGELFERCVKVAPMRFGSRKRWDVRAIDRWLDQQMLSYEADTSKSEKTAGADRLASELRRMLEDL